MYIYLYRVSIQLSTISYQLKGRMSLQKKLKVQHEKDDQLNLVIYYFYPCFLQGYAGKN